MTEPPVCTGLIWASWEISEGWAYEGGTRAPQSHHKNHTREPLLLANAVAQSSKLHLELAALRIQGLYNRPQRIEGLPNRTSVSALLCGPPQLPNIPKATGP